MPRRAVLLVCSALLAGCGGADQPLADELSRYTDAGDGCQQTVNAISYADELLKAPGQERYQVWDDATRSRVATVGGTVALEVRDFPSERALEVARRVAGLAEQTAARGTKSRQRVLLLREYRREAAELVLVCAREVPGV